ncbi:hypothetical protein ACTXT7_010137 [Hymenolepis weldensis]
MNPHLKGIRVKMMNFEAAKHDRLRKQQRIIYPNFRGPNLLPFPKSTSPLALPLAQRFTCSPEKSKFTRSMPISSHQVNGMANLPGYANQKEVERFRFFTKGAQLYYLSTLKECLESMKTVRLTKNM